MNVKAQGLFNAAKWIEQEYGQSALRDVLRACSPAVRDRYTSAIAINWHPMSELVEFLGVADRMLGTGDGKLAEEVGAAGARANMKGVMLRTVFYLAKPDFLLDRLTKLWSQFNDDGGMALLHLDAQSTSYEVTGTFQTDPLFCATLTGWGREVALAIGGVKPVVRHSMCRARGNARCVWELRWLKVTPREDAKTSAVLAAVAAHAPSAVRVARAPIPASRAGTPSRPLSDSGGYPAKDSGKGVAAVADSGKVRTGEWGREPAGDVGKGSSREALNRPGTKGKG